ncbi:hypothetical protein LTR10_014274 [Elasticomyces elasticus]|uniref:Uncharacterized protein n=1 Tax=Exophiala sideris TaxID=1016849 RepID=A0ABR0JI99_9EURO|nr:hypothetical protein LTR10_014274 [Elasticomyces elasticus]KAK5034315.1 hypothetical protein LTS07_003235 [Exophiala sideris]KAK5042612.1 hypothetical protein LTR13_001459 [Exophiala sideris]KAK5065694.1 hypothetical protein LTR69_003243 [Exophiala sideris]KAK5185848.1 hypothetical protein LTR44_001897 [Eurotiomycetes sp. CCFEE 6388]
MSNTVQDTSDYESSSDGQLYEPLQPSVMMPDERDAVTMDQLEGLHSDEGVEEIDAKIEREGMNARYDSTNGLLRSTWIGLKHDLTAQGHRRMFTSVLARPYTQAFGKRRES